MFINLANWVTFGVMIAACCQSLLEHVYRVCSSSSVVEGGERHLIQKVSLFYATSQPLWLEKHQ